MALFGTCAVGLLLTAGHGVDHRVLHRHRLQAGAHVARPPPPATAPTSSPASGVSMKSTAWPVIFVCIAILGLLRWRPVRHRHRRHRPCCRWPASSSRSTPTARSPTTAAASPRWPPARQRARRHRPAGRRGQHHQGRHQGCRSARPASAAGAVRRLHARARSRAASRPPSTCPTTGDRGPVHRRPDPLPVRRDGDGGRRPRRRLGGGRGAPPVPGRRDHGRHGQEAGLQRRGRHAHHGGDQGDDRPVAAAGVVPIVVGMLLGPARRWAAC